MTQRVLILAGCDLENGREAEDVETVQFSVDGRSYEMELCREHREHYLEKLQDNARPAGRRTPVEPAKLEWHRTMERRAHNAAIREWAKTNGYPVSATGRIPVVTQKAWENRHA